MNPQSLALALTVSFTALVGAGAEAMATPLDLEQPDQALTAFRKITCSVEDGKAVYFAWQGKVYSRVPGEADRHLFNIQGLSVRACTSLISDTGDPGFRQVSREVMLYLDSETSMLLDQWENPWTGQVNTVVPVANDPVNSNPFWADTLGQRLQFQTLGETEIVFLPITIPLFYPNPLGGDYQNYVGGHYHAMEMFSFAVPRSDLLDASQPEIEQLALGWSRISPWLPWMEMGSRPGELVFHAISTRLADWQQSPEPLRSQIANEFALYQTPPALDDTRPNETTWTNFHDFLEGQPEGR